MWIRQKDDGQNRGGNWIFLVVMTFLASGLLLLSVAEITGFQQVYGPWALLLSAAVVSVLCGLSDNGRTWIYPVLCLTAFLLVLIFGRQILDGWCIFWNQLGDAWTAGTGYVVPELESAEDGAHKNMGLLMFSLFFGGMTAFICRFIARMGKRLLAVFLPMVVLTGMVLFQRMDMGWHLVLTLVFSLCLLVTAGGERDVKSLLAAVWRSGLVVLGSIVLLLTSLHPAVQTWTEDMGTKTREKIHAAKYETAYTTLPEGQLAAYEEGKQSQTALIVNMEKPESMYLRGFTGTVFEEGNWNPLQPAALEEQEDLLYWLNVKGMNPNSQYAAAAALILDKKETQAASQSMTVQNVNACSKYMYVPYTLWGGEVLDAAYIGTDGAAGEGKRTYTYSVFSGDKELHSKLSTTLQSAKGKETKAYLQVEKEYGDFVSEHYLKVSDAVAEKLEADWKKTAKTYGGVKNLSTEEAQGCVREFLKQYAEEEVSSYEYATAAVMTMRYFGIPARYAEGYVITEDMAKAADEDGTIKVDSSQGGAWAEVYQNGLGWIPMGELPGMETEHIGLNPDAEGSELPKETPPEPQAQEEPETQQEELKPQGGYVVTLEENISLVFLLFFIPVLLLLAAIALRRRMIIKKRMQRWDCDHPGDGVAWIFADGTELLRRMGFVRGNGSMRALIEPVQEKLGESYGAELKKMIDLNDRAIFSSKPLHEDAREQAKAFYETTLQQMLQGMKCHQKLWTKWFLCLY